MLLLLFGERLLPARKVTLVNVVTLAAADNAIGQPPSNVQPNAAAADPYSAPVAFQASGWFEPDPQPTKVSALISGVVDQVFILEGHAVEEGEVIATLIDDDAKLDLATAQAQHEAARAKAGAHAVNIEVIDATIDALRMRIEAAEALLEYRNFAADRFADAGKETVKELDIIESRQLAVAQEAELAALQAEIRQQQAKRTELETICTQLNAEAKHAETEVARKELALERTRIKAPITGRVMRLLAVPGQQRMLGSENKDSAAIAYLYDPQKLQARIDVPLAEASQIQVGQAVRLRSNFLQDEIFHGVVIRVTGEADLQRNTLQAKVRVTNPSDRLRPEMLCRAEFLKAIATHTNSTNRTNPQSTKPVNYSQANVRLFVPENALLNRNGNQALVWITDASDERLSQQDILLGTEQRDGFIQVQDGLQPGDRVVANPAQDLKAGMRIVASSTTN